MKLSASRRCSAAVARSTLVFAGVATLQAALLGGNPKVWNVASGASIQATIDLAAPGDIVLVHAGTYAGFTIDGKALEVVAHVDPSAGEAVEVASEVTVANVAAGDVVVLQGDAFSVRGVGGPALALRASSGSIRICGLALFGPCGTGGADGVVGLSLDHALDVALTDLSIEGGTACDYPGVGGAAVEATASFAALYDVVTKGGDGSSDFSGIGIPGTDGGPGCLVHDGWIFASRCTFTGGSGASGSDGFGDCAAGGVDPGDGGDGGDGLVLASATAGARMMQTQRVGGAGGPVGYGSVCLATDGAPGAPENVATGAAFVIDPRVARVTHVQRFWHEKGTLLFQFDGEYGDQVFLFLAAKTEFVDLAPFSGVSLIAPPYVLRRSMGTIPSTGVLEAGVAISDLGPGVDGVVWYAQACVRTLSKKRVFGGPATLVVLDSQF